MNKSKHYLQQINIKGLWNLYDINWTLNRDVNILVGENGSGKSTILRLIAEFLSGGNEFLDTFQTFKFSKKGDALLHEMQLSFEDSAYWKLKIIDDCYQYDFDENTKNTSTPTKIAFKYIEAYDAAAAKFIPKNGQSYLDALLENAMNETIEYQLNQAQKILKKEKTAIEAFAKYNYFAASINRLFEKTGKQIDKTEKKLSFSLKNGTKLSPYDLSSGEKQLLVLLLNVLIQAEAPYIFLIDQVELGLHQTWQYDLLPIMRMLNPNCQFIIVTQSMSIYHRGYRTKVTGIGNILSNGA